MRRGREKRSNKTQNVGRKKQENSLEGEGSTTQLGLLFTQESLDNIGIPPTQEFRKAGTIEELNACNSVQEFVSLAANVNGQYLHCTLGNFGHFDDNIRKMMPELCLPSSVECQLKMKIPKVVGRFRERKLILSLELPEEVKKWVEELEKKVKGFKKERVRPHVTIAKEKYGRRIFGKMVACMEEWEKKEKEGRGKGEGEATLVVLEARVYLASDESSDEDDRIYREGGKSVQNRGCLWYSPKEEKETISEAPEALCL